MIHVTHRVLFLLSYRVAHVLTIYYALPIYLVQVKVSLLRHDARCLLRILAIARRRSSYDFVILIVIRVVQVLNGARRVVHVSTWNLAGERVAPRRLGCATAHISLELEISSYPVAGCAKAQSCLLMLKLLVLAAGHLGELAREHD